MHRIETLVFRDIDSILNERFGERYIKYRREWDAAVDGSTINPFPLHLDIESTGKCNLKCKMCSRYLNPGTQTDKGLSIDTIRNIIDEGSREGCYSLLYGTDDEPLIDADKFLTTADYALKKNFCDVWLGTNGIKLSREISKAIISMGLPRITISLDAIKPETYKKIRGVDQLSRVTDNIREFLDLRDKMGSKLPILRISFVVMNDNYGEMEEFKLFWKDKADVVIFQSYFDLSVNNHSIPHNVLNELRSTKRVCSHPFRRLTVKGDGYVYPCCCLIVNNSHKFSLGNIYDSSLKSLWDSDKMKQYQSLHRKGEFHKIEECLKCVLASMAAENVGDMK